MTTIFDSKIFEKLVENTYQLIYHTYIQCNYRFLYLSK